jgi:hypothetical protein
MAHGKASFSLVKIAWQIWIGGAKMNIQDLARIHNRAREIGERIASAGGNVDLFGGRLDALLQLQPLDSPIRRH